VSNKKKDNDQIMDDAAEKEACADKSEKDLLKENEALVKENENLKEEIAALNDKYTRMIAEYDNFRKRMTKEKEGAYSDAYGDALSEILPIKDNLELAVKYSEADKFADGVLMTLSKFSDILKKLGVEEFGCEGETFDPTVHNAVMHIEDESLGENVITDVM